MNDAPYTYAGFWLRALAYTVDTIIMLIPCWVLTQIYVIIVPELLRATRMEIVVKICLLILIVCIAGMNWLYFTILESSKKKATYGKEMFGLIVTDMHGQRISFKAANKRFFGKILSGFIFNIGFMMAGFTAQKQALHDFLAHTLVLKHKSEISNSF
jgi:uncharacterized RDD family membrane protein YckC